MKLYMPYTHKAIQLLMTGVMGWMVMACSTETKPESTEALAQTARGDTCMTDEDCGSSHEFCNFELVDDPTLGGICDVSGGQRCNPDNSKCIGVFTDPPDTTTTDSGGAPLYCSFCTCTSESGSFEGVVCGHSTDELVDECWNAC